MTHNYKTEDRYIPWGATEEEARLFNAAPELLEALKQICFLYEERDNSNMGDMYKVARAAIAKAEGSKMDCIRKESEDRKMARCTYCHAPKPGPCECNCWAPVGARWEDREVIRLDRDEMKTRVLENSNQMLDDIIEELKRGRQ